MKISSCTLSILISQPGTGIPLTSFGGFKEFPNPIQVEVIA